MPLSKYNTQFGGKPGSASKAHSAMQEQYGSKRGEAIFHMLKNKRKAKLKKENSDAARSE
jgi:hypothetical protein